MEVQVPWLDTFELGQGIDALTGAAKGRALEDIMWSPEAQPSDHKSSATSRIIHHLHELHHDVHAGTTATINISSPVALSASFDYLRSRSWSSSSSMIEYKVDGQYGIERPPLHTLELTPEARECLTDPKKFRERYGDYFVYGFQRGYSFYAIVQYR
jgi:hypothetical protein